MSTSSSDGAPATLRLRGARSTDELTVVDGSFRPVASGIGTLEATLEPGIYEIVARAGPTIARRLIRLAAGEVREAAAPAVAFPSSAPIPGSAGEDNSHLDRVRAASASIADRAGLGALCVVVRAADDGDPRPIVGHRELSLRDDALHEVAEFGSEWRLDDAGTIAIWSGATKPGGYALRLGSAPDAVDLALWLPEGWTLLVFMAADVTGGIRARSVTVHLVRKAEAWTGNQAAVATELALWGLREGRPQAVGTVLQAIAEDKMEPNPIVDIAVAHLLLEGPLIDDKRVASIIDRLARTAPDQPDVIAVQLAAKDRGVGLQGPPRLPVAWPPMLLASYPALIRRDAATADAFALGSVAERVVGSITAGTIWSTWRPIPSTAQIPPRVGRTKVDLRRVLEKAARKPGKLRRPKYSDPATRRVAAYLNAVADLDDGRHGVASLSPAQIALATGLPTATVDQSLRRIWLSIAGFTVLPFVFTLAALVGLFVVANLGMQVSLPLFSFPPITSPSPSISLLPHIEEWEFGLLASPIGVPTAAVQPIRNIGEAPLTILNISTAGDAGKEFTYEEGVCRQAPIAPQEQCTVFVTFTPQVVGERVAELSVETLEIGTITIALRGIGISPQLEFDPRELVLRPEATGEVVISVDGIIGIKSVEITGDTQAFELTKDDCEGRVLQPEERCSIFVTQTSGGAEFDAHLDVLTDNGVHWGIRIFGGSTP